MVRDRKLNAKDRKGRDFGNQPSTQPLVDSRRASLPSNQVGVMPPSLPDQLWDVGDGTFRTHHERAAFRKGAYRIESESRFPFSVDAARIVWRVEVENEVLSHDEQTLGRDRRAKSFAACVCLLLFFLQANGRGVHLLVVSHSREERLRLESRERPRLAAVVGEREVRTVLVGMLVVTSSDHTVPCVAERNRKNACRFRSVKDGRVEDFPGFSAVG